MVSEIVESSGSAVPLQVTRARADHASDGSELSRDETTVRQATNPQCDVDMLFDQVDVAVAQAKLDVDLRIRLEKFCCQRHNVQAAKPSWPFTLA